MATSSTDAVPVDQLESLLTCPICLETLNEPRTLPCFHSFCKICLEKFVKRHREKAAGKKIEVFNCPTCRSEFHLKPKDEVAGMASSHFIRNMLDVMAIQPRAIKEKLASCCTILEESLKDGNDTLELISNAKQSLEDNAKKAKKDITRQKEEVLKIFTQKLEEKAKLMMKEVEKKHKQAHEPLVEQETEVKRHVDKVKGSFNLAKKLLKKGNDEEILSSQKMIEENIERMKQERPWSIKPVHDGSIEYQSTLNDNDVTTFLDKLGKVACRPAAVHGALCKTSIILNGHFEYGKQMEKWLGDHFQWRLCYRATRDGWHGRYFHRCCDNKGPTVTLVKVGDYICGGYTDQNWEGQGVYTQSNSSFLFSLKNKDDIPAFKCDVHKKQHAIYSNPNYGPSFGGGFGGFDFHISDNSNHNEESYSDLGSAYPLPPGYQPGTAQTRPLLAGSCYFTPTEIEVFY